MREKEFVMATQNISLSPKLEEFVQRQISKGYYSNASEVYRAALVNMVRLERKREIRRARLKQEIEVGLEDIKKGRYTEIKSNGALGNHLEEIYQQVVSKTGSK